jgi:hypothetical protein
MKTRYQAVFYSGRKIIDVSDVKDTREEAEQVIKDQEETYSVFVFTPWDRTEIVDVRSDISETRVSSYNAIG